MGHTFPGATVPFGMVQLSPDTDTLQYLEAGKYNPEMYRYCAGYQYDDKSIVGFSHTHFSGTGHSDLGDFLIMPTVGELKLNPGVASVPRSGYRSAFKHANEKAGAGYYAVQLDDYNVKAELTATERVGFHQYTFPQTKEAHIILDLVHGIYNYPEKNVWTFVRVENDTLITGYRQTLGWARTKTVYFALSFSKPIESYGCTNDKKEMYRGFWGKFNQKAWGKIKIKQGLKFKQVPDALIKKALQTIDADSYLQTLEKVIKKKLAQITEKDPYKRRYKLQQYALSRGYEADLILDVLKNSDL